MIFYDRENEIELLREIEKNSYNYAQMTIIMGRRDYETFSGLVLEKYFRAKLIETKQFSEISSYWNRKGEDEIDLIAINEIEKIIIFYEVKRNKKRISIPTLEKKATEITRKYHGYCIEYKAFSLEDM